jgi:PAS domain S-box-containing protein
MSLPAALSKDIHPGVVILLRRAACVLAILVAAVALFVLVSWATETDRFESVFPNLYQMNPLTAVCFVLCAAGLLLAIRFSPEAASGYAGPILGGMVATLAIVRLFEVFTRRADSIDLVLFSHTLAARAIPGRMAPNTAIAFVVTGLSLVFMNVSPRLGRRTSQVLALGVGSLSALALLGHSYRNVNLYSMGSSIPMAVHTAALFLVCTIGILFASSDRGLMAVVTSNTAAGKVARRVLPAAVLIPAILGWLRVYGGSHHWFAPSMGLPMVVLANTLFFTALLWWEMAILRRAELRRVGTEAQLRANEARTRLIVDTAHDAFVAMDAEGRIIDWNPQAEKMFGWQRSLALSQPLVDVVVPPKYRAAYEAGLKTFLETGKGEVFDRRLEFSALRLDGSEFPVELTITPARVDDSPVFFSFIHDITARKRNRAERDRFFELSLDMVCVAGFDGYFKQLNPAFEQVLGYTAQELMARMWVEFVHPDDRQRTIEEGQKLAAGVRTLYFENRYLCKDGKYKWLSWKSVPVVADGLIYAVARDMTAYREAEKQLRQANARLDETAQSERQAHAALKQAQSRLVQSEKLAGLGQMVAGVAHEINNPLAFVGNNVAVLQRDLGAVFEVLNLHGKVESASPEDRAALVSRIRELGDRFDLDYVVKNLPEVLVRSREGLRRIHQIVRDLRDFARLDEGDIQDADLNAGIVSTINIIQGYARRKRVSIETKLESIPPVRCHAAKINQVVMNLLSNAIDASHEETSVTVSTGCNGKGVYISVADTGTGIEAAVRERIFDPFFTTKPPGHGTGLGLSISYGIVKAQGGEIVVDSTPGRGSCFTVHLPAKPHHPS